MQYLSISTYHTAAFAKPGIKQVINMLKKKPKCNVFCQLIILAVTVELGPCSKLHKRLSQTTKILLWQFIYFILKLMHFGLLLHKGEQISKKICLVVVLTNLITQTKDLS